MKRFFTLCLLGILSLHLQAQFVPIDFEEFPSDFIDGDDYIDLGKKKRWLPIGPVNLQGRYQKSDDPNLDPNWDWTSPTAIPVMYYSPNGAIPTPIYNRFVPFWTSGNPLAAEKDMYPEDGWQLVWKDFGIPTDGPTNPFFALYNKYRGILRFMIYNANNDAYTMFKGELSFRSDSPKTPLFTHTADEKAFIGDFDSNQKEIYMGTGAKYNDWITLDFVTYGYKDNMNNNMILHLEVDGIDDSQINLGGTITLDEKLKKSALGGSKFGANNVIDAFKQGHSFYKGIEDFRNDMQSSANSANNTGKWWSGPLKGIAEGSIATALPVISGVVGLISSFIGGKNKPAPREPLKFEGEIELTGSIKLEQSLIRDDFKTSPGGFSPDRYTSVQTIDWGVLSPTVRPRVAMQRIEECREHWYDGEITCYQTHNNIMAPQFPLTPYHFNSDLGMTIISETAAYVFANRAGTPYKSFNSFTQTVYEDYPVPTGISIKIIYRINNPVINSDTELVMVKTIPIDLGWSPTNGCSGDCYGYNGRTGAASEEAVAVSEDLEILGDLKMEVYPNPIHDMVNLVVPMNEAGSAELVVMDLNGRILISETRELQKGSNQWTLNVSNNDMDIDPNGIYILNVKTPFSNWKEKIVVTR